MIRTIAALAAPLFLLGCANNTYGTYLIQVPNIPEIETEEEITENFDDADPREESDGGAITVTEEVTYSNGLAFGQFMELDAKKEAVLVVGDRAYMGTWDKDAKEWVFIHENREDGTETEEGDGYSFTRNGITSITTTYRMNLKEGTGALKIAVNVDLSWTETDEWDPAIGRFQGIIPSTVWLEGTGNVNQASGPECSGSTCELSVVSTGSVERPISFTPVDADDDAVFEAVENAGQPVGTGDN